jgi:hypothetical protein
VHFVYGVVVALVGGFGCLSIRNANTVATALLAAVARRGVVVADLDPSDLHVVQALWLEVASSALYSLVAAVWGAPLFGRRFYSCQALGHFAVSVLLIFASFFLAPPAAVLPSLLSCMAFTYTLIGVVNLVLLLFVARPSSPVAAHRRLFSVSQCCHAVYDLSILILAFAAP